MIQIILMIIFGAITIYNLVRFSEIIVRAKITLADIISIIVIIFLIYILFRNFLALNIYNYLLATVFLLYAVSGILVKGYNKRGVFDFWKLTHLARFTKWNKIDDIKFEYLKDNSIDVIFVTKTRVIRHRYDEKLEKEFIKLKKHLKIS